MSRHQLPALSPGHTAFVGWDKPLQSFFAQVYVQGTEQEGKPVFWVGADRPRQVSEIDHLAHFLKGRVDLSPAMRRLLFEDREFGR